MIKKFDNFNINENSNDGVIVYHGGGEELTDENLKDGPIFTTSNRQEAIDYAIERGNWLTKLRVKIVKPLTLNNKIDFKQKWMPLLDEANIDYNFKEYGKDGWDFNCEEIEANGGYTSDHIFDLVYIPSFVEVAKREGYDGIIGEDPVANYTITVYIPFSKSNVDVLKSEHISDDDMEEFYEKFSIEIEEYLRENITDLLGPKSDDEMDKELEMELNNIRIEKIFKNKLPKTLLPRDENGICYYYGDLNISGLGLTELPENLTIYGDLNIRNNNITSLPKGLVVEGNLNIINNPELSLDYDENDVDIQGKVIDQLSGGYDYGGSYSTYSC